MCLSTGWKGSNECLKITVSTIHKLNMDWFGLLNSDEGRRCYPWMTHLIQSPQWMAISTTLSTFVFLWWKIRLVCPLLIVGLCLRWWQSADDVVHWHRFVDRTTAWRLQNKTKHSQTVLALVATFVLQFHGIRGLKIVLGIQNEYQISHSFLGRTRNFKSPKASELPRYNNGKRRTWNASKASRKAIEIQEIVSHFCSWGKSQDWDITSHQRAGRSDYCRLPIAYLIVIRQVQ
jgi:hypothetical protein